MAGTNGSAEPSKTAFDTHFDWQVKTGIDDEKVFVVDPTQLGEATVSTCPKRAPW